MTTVQVLDEGIWFPEIGFALDCVRLGSPSLILSDTVLCRMGRQKGILAPESVWSVAFPARKKPRVPVPTDRELRLGKLSIRLIESRADNLFSSLGFCLIIRADEREILIVSQFTLYGDCRRGRRPSFTGAAPPELAEELIQKYFTTNNPRITEHGPEWGQRPPHCQPNVQEW